LTSARLAIAPGDTVSTLVLWANRGMEALWLLAAALIPIAFLDRDFVSSEAVIAYVEVPKIALLRVIAALIAILLVDRVGYKGSTTLLTAREIPN